jgi:hypothetical protein
MRKVEFERDYSIIRIAYLCIQKTLTLTVQLVSMLKNLGIL